MTACSLLDLSPIPEGGDAALALRNTADVARHAERWGYRRFWLAEHHNMPGIASAATAVVIGHVAAATSTIRVGAGGIMLPNHAPLVIAEQFGTLATLFPGRIDLGLGRAPGTDPLTTRALRRNLDGDVDAFPRDVIELQHYFSAPDAARRVQAVPGAGVDVPTLDGTARLRVPPGTRSGQRFRLREHGVPSPRRGGARGDLVVTVNVVLPPVADERSRALLREFGRLNATDVRKGLFED